MSRNARTAQNLIYRAEVVADSEDWKHGRQHLEDLMEEWKQLGQLPQIVRESLWQQFRTVRQRYFDRRKEHFRRVEAEQEENARAKQALIDRIEALRYCDDSREARNGVKSAQQEWKQIGRVPKDEMETLWTNFRAACDAVYENARQADIERLEARLSNQREFLAKIEQSMSKAESFVSMLEGFRNPPWDKIADVQSQIREKSQKITEVEASISDLETRLYNLRYG